ncbi:multidrug effflux MFS transporter [Tahibacter amnicola]|uniref:Bcr/CflA family efflux transporter n=1 Tax=Tahibacter amnicola TaxID=2976241 RepID=A0ABY6B9M2_9GAMM|nr:multidrug effflux MFS transporter [Tahibacter amnicola]UXI66756.1 multidrug effflux MFS transporter [Tahibacter amnicola]
MNRTIRRGLTPLLAGLAMFGPFSIDTMFPAFPAIRAQFQVDEFAVQQTLSVYLMAYALVSLFHGPLSDARGRRPVILWGVAIFMLASIGCAMAWSLPSLLFFRAIQGVSAGSGLIVGRAIIRDLYEGPSAQRLMSNISMMFTIAPAVAPIIGGWLLGLGQWRLIFYFLAAWAAVLLVASMLLLPETHPREKRLELSLGSLYAGYSGMARDAHFWPLVIASTGNFSALFVYIASAPRFILDLLQLGPQEFAWLFVPAVSGMFVGALASSRMAGRLSAAHTVGMGYAIMLAASAANLVTCLLLPKPAVPWTVLPIAVHAIGISMTFPTITLLLLDRFPQHRGGASSMQSFVSLVFNAVLAGVIVIHFSHSALYLAVAAATLTVTGFAGWRIYRALAKRELAQARAADVGVPRPM